MCFETLIGLSNIDGCDCGRPDGTDTIEQMHYEVFVSETPVDPLVLTLTYSLPLEVDIQVYEAGALIPASRFSASTNELSIDDPLDNTTYQVWYLANVSAISTIPAYDTSDSGLFLSDILPESELKGLRDCNKTEWVVQSNSRTTAIKETVASINAAILRKNNKKHTTFTGHIGKQDGDYLTSAFSYVGVRIRTNPIKSGYLRISRLSALFEKNGIVNMTIYSSDGTVVSPTIPITTAAGRAKINDVGITLPMLSDFSTCQDYYIVYEYDPLNKPRLNKTYCAGCNGSQVANTVVNRYGMLNEWPTDYRGPLSWNNYIIIGGIEVDSVDSFDPDENTNLSQFMNGISLEIEIGCDLTKGLCSMIKGGGPEAMAFATAVQRRAASLSVSKRNLSSVPNRENTAKGEEQAKQAAEWEADFAEAVSFLTQTITEYSNDCVSCRSRMSLGQILT